MRLADVERFVEIPHCELTHDCADLAMEVARELFGRSVVLPQARPRPKGCATQAAALALAMGELCEAVPYPEDGDLVLMTDCGQVRPGHIGTYFFLAHEGWVLHTTHALGFSCLHRLRELAGFGLRVSGYYRWRA